MESARHSATDMAPAASLAAGVEEAADERADYWLRHLPAHLASQERWTDLANLLLHPDFLEDKVKSLGMSSILDDLDLIDRRDFPARTVLEQLRAAMRLAAAVVGADHTQLASQLSCRLAGETGATLTAFREALEQSADRSGPWLSSLHPSLVQAGSALRSVLPLHIGGNSGVRFLDDDAIVGVQGNDVSVWSLANGDELHRLSGAGHELQCFEVNMSRSLLVCADEYAIHAWDIKGRSKSWTAGHECGAPEALVIAESAGLLLVLGATEIGIFDLRTGAAKGVCKAEILRCLALTPDGTGFLSGSIDGRIDLWALPDKELRRFAYHGTLKGPRVSSSEFLFQDQAVRPIWTESGDTLKPMFFGDLEGAEDLLEELDLARARPDSAADAINALSFAAGGTRVLSASADRSACIWSWPGGELLHCLPGHGAAVTSVAAIPGRDAVVTASEDGNVRIWDLSQQSSPRLLSARGLQIASLAVSPSGKTIAATGREGHVELYDLGASVAMPKVFHPGGVRAIASITEPPILVTVGSAEISHRSVPDLVQVHAYAAPSGAVLWVTLDGRRLLMQESGRSGTTILAVDVSSGEVIQRLPVTPPSNLPQGWEQGWRYIQAACDDAGLRLMSVGTGAKIATARRKAGLVALWDFRSGRQIALLHENGAHARVAIAPNASLAFMLDQFELTAVHADDGRQFGRLDVAAHGPMMVTRDCRYCVIAGDGLLVWVGLEAHLSLAHRIPTSIMVPVERLCGNADGSLIATVHADGSIACWSWDAGLIGRFVADGPVTSIALIDERTIVAGDRLGRLHVLSLRPAQGADAGLRAVPVAAPASPWSKLDLARQRETAREAGAAITLWNELAACEEASLAPLSKLARDHLALLGNEDTALALDLRVAASGDRPRVVREEALARLEAAGRAGTIAELMLRIEDADLSLTDSDGWLVAAGARVLARLGAASELTAVMENRAASLVARIASASALLPLGAAGAAESFLSNLTLDPAVPVSLALVAQRLLTDCVTPERAIELLSAQYPEYAHPRLCSAAVERLIEIGDIGHAALGLYHGTGKDEVPDIFWTAARFGTLGMKHIAEGNTRSAIRAYEQATALAPGNAVFHFNLGGLCLRDRRPHDAVACFSRALALDPHYEKAYCELGTAHRLLKQYDQAVENYSRSIELEPGDAFTYERRAEVYRLLDANERALSDEQMAAQLGSSGEAPAGFNLVAEKTAGPPRRDMSQLAAAALASIGVADVIAEKLLKIAIDNSASQDVCFSSMQALGKLSRLDALAELARDPRLDAGTQATAFYLWAMAAPEEAGPQVRRMITDPHADETVRRIAVEILVQAPARDMLLLAAQIPDLSFQGNDPSIGLQLAAHLIRAYAAAYDHDAIREMAFGSGVPAALREQAGEWLALSGNIEGKAVLESLSADQRVDPVTRAVAARSLKILQSREAVHEPAPDESDAQMAFDSLCAAQTEQEVSGLAEKYPVVTKFAFILQLRRVALELDQPAERARMLQKIRWIEGAPTSFEDQVLRLAFDARGEAELRRIADRYSILANRDFQAMLCDIVTDFGSPADKSALALRLRWMQRLEANPIQEALQELMNCLTQAQVLKYAETHPIIRSPGFIDTFQRTLRNALPEHTRKRAERILAWVQEAGGDEGRLLDAAQALVAARDDAGAILLLDRLIAGVEPPRFSFMLRGLVNANLDRHDKAVSDFTEYIKRGGVAATTYERRGRSYVHLKRWGKAVEDFNQAIILDGENDGVLFGLAVAYDALGNRKASRSAMARLVELCPDDTGILMSAAYFAYGDGDLSRARNLVQRALTLDPGCRQALELQGALASEGLGTQTKAKDSESVSRNQPCPCGSGKRYKQCHGALS